MAAPMNLCMRCIQNLRRFPCAPGILSKPLLVAVNGGVLIEQTRGAKKHWNPKYRKERGLKVIKIDLPDYDKMRKDAMLDPDEQVREMKKKGEQPYRQSIDRPMVVASTNAVFEAYVPPEGDGKASLLETAGAKQRLTGLEKKGKSYMQARKIRQYDPDFDTKTFPEQAEEIYIQAHKLLEDLTENEEKLHGLVTEFCYPQMTWKLDMKSYRWDYIETLEAPRVVHIRLTELMNKDDVYAQVTVRFHSKQTLALYDRFGRLMYGSENLIKDVLEYVVFEKHLSDEYGEWRIHAKIIPDWMPPRAPVSRTLRKPVMEDPVKTENTETVKEEVVTPSRTAGDQPTPAMA